MRAPEWEGRSGLRLAGAALLSVAVHAAAVPAWLRQRPAPAPEPAAVPLVAVLVPPSTPRPEAAPVLPVPKERRPSRRKANEAAAAPRAVQPAPPPVSALIDAPGAAEAPPARPRVAPLQGDALSANAPASEPDAAPSSAPVFDALYLENPRPAYPALSRRLREEGRVLLRVLVTAQGRAAQVQIQASSGHERLDAAARDAVARWRFVPARRGEEPVEAWVLVPISFSLQG